MPEPAGIFAVEVDPDVSHDDMIFHGAEDLPDRRVPPEELKLMRTELDALEAKGFVRRFGSAADVVTYLGDNFIESKLFILKQEKHGVVKHRVLLDCKRSAVSTSSQKSERVRLPKALDTVYDLLELTSSAAVWVSDTDLDILEDDDYDVSFGLLDVSDAFWNIPLHPKERKYFVCRCQGDYYVVLCTAQGSRTAPLTWGRVMSMSDRMAQSTCPPNRLRIETYVDDPLIMVRGTIAMRKRILVRVILIWLAIGHRLAWHKGQLGSKVTWISVTYACSRTTIVASIKQELLDDISALCHNIARANVHSLRELRTLVGKCVHAASLLYVWRPFVRLLWGPLLKDAPTDAVPTGCYWTKRISVSVHWILAFLGRSQGTVSRSFDLRTYLGAGVRLSITVDASPHGLGGVLTQENDIVEYFSCGISDTDLEIHSLERGSHRGQQCLEGLATLVALRVWAHHWREKRMLLRVRGDSITALTMLLEMRASGPTMGLIAREIALDVADALCTPNLVEHIPGVSNVLADTLSRLEVPGGNYKLPECLESVHRAQVGTRPRSFYRTLEIEDTFRQPR